MFKKLSEAELDVMLVIWNAQESLDTGEIVRKLKPVSYTHLLTLSTTTRSSPAI